MLSAMRAVALADGVETPKERALLDASRAALALNGTVDDYAPLELRSLSGLDMPIADRERIVQTMMLMSVMDGSGALVEAELIEAFAKALSVEEPRLVNLRQLAEGRIDAMRWDFARKGYAKDELIQTAKDEGLRGLYRTFGPLIGLANDATLAKKYNDLGTLGEGTLGRAYWRFIVDNNLSFPGEPHGVPERGTWHDMSHVLGGYPVTPAGEALVVAFIAGYRKHDPFFWLFGVALQFQVGLKISPFAAGARDQVDPHLFVRHHTRGAQMTRDISVGWDPYPEMTRPIADVRRELNVLPL